MGNVQGRSDRDFTEPAGLEVQLAGAAGGSRSNLNLQDATSNCPAPCFDPAVTDNPGQGRADVQLRPRSRVGTAQVTVPLNGADYIGRELLSPAAYGAQRFVVDEVVARVLSVLDTPSHQPTTIKLALNGVTEIAALSLRLAALSSVLGSGAVLDLSTLGWGDQENGLPTSLAGKVQPGTLQITYQSGAATRTITDDGAGNLVGDVTGGAVDYDTGALAGSTSLAVDVGDQPQLLANLAAGNVRRWRLGLGSFPAGLSVNAPDALTCGKNTNTSAFNVHQVRVQAYGRLIF